MTKSISSSLQFIEQTSGAPTLPNPSFKQKLTHETSKVIRLKKTIKEEISKSNVNQISIWDYMNNELRI